MHKHKEIITYLIKYIQIIAYMYSELIFNTPKHNAKHPVLEVKQVVFTISLCVCTLSPTQHKTSIIGWQTSSIYIFPICMYSLFSLSPTPWETSRIWCQTSNIYYFSTCVGSPTQQESSSNIGCPTSSIYHFYMSIYALCLSLCLTSAIKDKAYFRNIITLSAINKLYIKQFLSDHQHIWHVKHHWIKTEMWQKSAPEIKFVCHLNTINMLNQNTNIFVPP